MIQNTELTLNVLKVFGLSALSFIVAILLTPLLTHFLYKYKMWRKDVRQEAADGSKTPIYQSLHKEGEISIPRLGGLLFWTIPALIAFLFYWLAKTTDIALFDKLNFLSRNQTWLPFLVMIAGASLGLIDDLLQIYGKGTYKGGGMALSRRIFFVLLIASAGAYWFYFKLGWQTIYIPGLGDIYINGLYIPLFIVTMLGVFSGGVIDGIDGLAGGVFASIFASYAGIAFFRNQIDIAAFAAVILGALLAFLWFNIPPARFYMGETGMLGLTTAITVIAFLTDSIIVLPIIAFLLVVETASVIIQFSSKKWLGRKVFLVAPIHHHFEARGWPPYKVTMRFWVISIITAIIGMVIALIGR